MANVPRIVTFYTKNTPYEERARILEDSLHAFDLTYTSLAVNPQGGWVQNCAMKPRTICQLAERYGLPLIWMDADCEVFKYPSLLARQDDEDIAAHYMEYRHGAEPRKRWRSTVVCLYDTPSARTFLGEWADECDARPDEWDQRVMADVMFRHERLNNLKVRKLPHEYCFLRGLDSVHGSQHPPRQTIEHLRRRLWHPDEKKRLHRGTLNG